MSPDRKTSALKATWSHLIEDIRIGNEDVWLVRLVSLGKTQRLEFVSGKTQMRSNTGNSWRDGSHHLHVHQQHVCHVMNTALTGLQQQDSILWSNRVSKILIRNNMAVFGPSCWTYQVNIFVSASCYLTGGPGTHSSVGAFLPSPDAELCHLFGTHPNLDTPTKDTAKRPFLHY